MKAENMNPQEDPRIQAAVKELQGMIQARYPAAKFALRRGIDDPEAVYLKAIVDIADTDEVLDLVIERVLELQIDEGLPVHVLPLRPLEREIEEMRTHRSRWQPPVGGSPLP